jgi:hypothetical protein
MHIGKITIMLTQTKHFNCLTSYALETCNSVDLATLDPFFERLPVDPYLAGNYRFRRMSRFQIVADRPIQLPHGRLFQSKAYNPLMGDVVREFAELEADLIALPDFQTILREFFAFCQPCLQSNEVDVHQIRTIAAPNSLGHPAPEGIHQDGADLVGIFCVNRQDISGGQTELYTSKQGSPIFTKILNPGELLVFSDRQFFHFTSIVHATSAAIGVRDVFVFTCPGLFPPEP